MTLYIYRTGEAVRDLTEDETVAYLAMIANDHTHTGAVPGDLFGIPDTVYAI